MSNYTILHLHSTFSNGVTNIDSITPYSSYIEAAKNCGMNALAFSEHGSVFGWLKKKEAIEAAGMKYIHAEEFYVTETLEEKIKDNKHCLLIALNYDGFLELNKLSSTAFNRNDNHFYYVPRISIDELLSTSDNIVVSTACLGGILVEGSNEMRKKFLDFILKNKHRCYLEIQHHNVSEQIAYNQYLYTLHKKYGIKLLACTDTHALNEEHLEARSILQKAKNIHFDNENGWDLVFKTYDGLVEAYRKQAALPESVYLKAIENTNKIADMVEEFEIDRSYKYPHLWEDSERVFKDKIEQGIKNRGVDKYPNLQEYIDRIKYELEAYKHNQAIDFMLLMEDIVSWCRTQDIQIGYGRGSVNGSVIAWLIGITEMDSIKHNLNFDRFMNIERVSLSDVDTDFPPSRIDDVKKYIFSHHGLYCSDIVTFNTIADKGAIRDVGRALEIPLKTVGEICDAVDNEEEYKKVREEYPELFKYVDLVKGVIVSVGSHPCGVIVSPETLEDNIGTFTTSTDEYPVSQIYMKEVDSLNYVKLDCLKLDTIEIISNTCKMAGIPMVIPDNLDINDVDVWNSMRDDTTGIFQWEGSTGDNYIKRLLSDESIKKFQKVNKNVDRMMLLSIGNSAIRPAGASYRDDLANGVVRKSGSEAIDDFLSNTFGYLVFQCQIIEFLHSYCGFTMGEADVVRRHFAKKTGTEDDIPIIKDGGYMTKEKKHYIPGFVTTMADKYGMSKDEAEKTIVAFLKVIEDASSYLFSINHSEPYSYEGYACGWLRYHYPTEFLTAELQINVDNEEKTNALTSYAYKNGVHIKPVSFRHSQSNYVCDAENKTIYKGLSSIKFMSSQVAQELYDLRDNEYPTFVDLLVDIQKTSCDSRQLDILIKIGFFSEFCHPKQLLKQVEIFTKLYGKKVLAINKIESLGVPMYLAEKHAGKKTAKQLRDFDSLALIKDICAVTEYEKTTIIDQIRWEQELLGYISVTVPELDKDYFFVKNLYGYDNNMAELYCLKNGNSVKIKISKQRGLTKLKKGDIIKVLEITKRKKWKKIGEDPETKKPLFEQIDELEMVLTDYNVVKTAS